MENAAKALNIIGGVLIALVVLSIVIFGYNKIRSYVNKKDEVKKSEQLVEFNSKFEAYNKSIVKGNEIISLANLVADNNKKYTEYTKIKVYAKPTLKNIGSFPNSANVIRPGSNGTYYDMVDYIVTVHSGGTSYFFSDSVSDDERKEFKELYFKCSKVEYDTSKTSAGAGRVTAMWFDRIK